MPSICPTNPDHFNARLHHLPNPSYGDDANAERHFDAVLKFYLEHQWLSEAVPSAFAKELALAKLLGNCESFEEREVGFDMVRLGAVYSPMPY